MSSITFPSSCEECNQDFSSRIEYLVHREFSHGDNLLAQDANGAMCSECGDTFEIPIRLLGHMKTYHGRDLEKEETMRNYLNFPYICCFCPTGYHTKLNLKLHANKLHKDLFKGDIKMKMMTHRFTCHPCHVKFRLAHLYHIHLQTNHPDLYNEKVVNGEIKDG